VCKENAKKKEMNTIVVTSATTTNRIAASTPDQYMSTCAYTW